MKTFWIIRSIIISPFILSHQPRQRAFSGQKVEILRQTMNANHNSIVHFIRNSHNKYIYIIRSIENELTIKTLPYILLIWYHIAYITIAITMHPCHIYVILHVYKCTLTTFCVFMHFAFSRIKKAYIYESTYCIINKHHDPWIMRSLICLACFVHCISIATTIYMYM